MKQQVIGVKRVHGKSKVGNQFDMCSLLCVVPVEPGTHGEVQIEGHGSEVAEMVMDAKAVPQFAFLKPGQVCEVDLVTDQRFFRGKFETVVVGVAKPQPVAASGR